MRYLSTVEVLIREHAKAARASSDAGRVQALVNADPCAQGTCCHTHDEHRTTERPVVMAGSIEMFQ